MIKAAIRPTIVTNVTTINQLNDIILIWNAPSSNSAVDFGDSITGYQILIRTNNT